MSAQPHTPTFVDTLASEWRKLVAMRAMRVSMYLVLVVSVGLSVLSVFGIAETIESWSREEQAAFDPIDYALGGVLFGYVLLVVISIRIVTAEYASGMMRLTFTVTPRRWRIVAAKAALALVVTLVLSFVVTVLSVATAQIVFAAYDMDTADLASSGFWGTALKYSLTTPVLPIIGVAIGFVLRSTAGAIIAALALMFAPEILAAVLPATWQDIADYTPLRAADVLALGDTAPAQLSNLEAVVTLVAWIAGAFAIALAMVTRRDA